MSPKPRIVVLGLLAASVAAAACNGPRGAPPRAGGSSSDPRSATSPAKPAPPNIVGRDAAADHWSVKEYRPGRGREAERWFFRKNLAPSVRPGDARFPFIAYLTFSYTPRDESGLPSKEDDMVLYRIEDRELAALEAGALSVHVASALKSGVKDLLFYTRDPVAFRRAAATFQRAYPLYRISCEITRDPDWSHYNEFP